MTQTKPECRNCADFRDCLFHVKERDDERKQALLSKIIDHSEVHSNEMGTCLLNFLNRMYGNPVGIALFKNLILFQEISEDDSCSTMTVPLSRPVLDLFRNGTPDTADMEQGGGAGQDLLLRIILIHRRFPNNQKANIGLIAHEVARMFSSNDQGMNQVLEILPGQEARTFGKMDIRLRTNWLIEKWGFTEEHEAFRNEVTQLGAQKNRWGM